MGCLWFPLLRRLLFSLPTRGRLVLGHCALSWDRQRLAAFRAKRKGAGDQLGAAIRAVFPGVRSFHRVFPFWVSTILPWDLPPVSGGSAPILCHFVFELAFLNSISVLLNSPLCTGKLFSFFKRLPVSPQKTEKLHQIEL